MFSGVGVFFGRSFFGMCLEFEGAPEVVLASVLEMERRGSGEGLFSAMLRLSKVLDSYFTATQLLDVNILTVDVKEAREGFSWGAYTFDYNEHGWVVGVSGGAFNTEVLLLKDFLKRMDKERRDRILELALFLQSCEPKAAVSSSVR